MRRDRNPASGFLRVPAHAHRPSGTSGARVLVGTCSWTDTTLTQGSDWYPRRSMSAADRLAFYAVQYPLAETDSSYFPPRPEVAKSWVERTPAGFTMNVKAYSLLTGHPTKPASLWRDIRDDLPPDLARQRAIYAIQLSDSALDEAWRRFVDVLRPLHAAGKLGAVLMQYPQWFTPKRANHVELTRMRERMEDLPVCVEFRAPGWLEPDHEARTCALLRELGLALVVVDAPRASNLRTVLRATSDDLAVVRFHGRNDERWNHSEISAERSKYLYTRHQLEAWIPKIEQLASQTLEVHVLMNNCYSDFGVRNAADLQHLLLEADSVGRDLKDAGSS